MMFILLFLHDNEVDVENSFKYDTPWRYQRQTFHQLELYVNKYIIGRHTRLYL